MNQVHRAAAGQNGPAGEARPACESRLASRGGCPVRGNANGPACGSRKVVHRRKAARQAGAAARLGLAALLCVSLGLFSAGMPWLEALADAAGEATVESGQDGELADGAGDAVADGGAADEAADGATDASVDADAAAGDPADDPSDPAGDPATDPAGDPSDPADGSAANPSDPADPADPADPDQAATAAAAAAAEAQEDRAAQALAVGDSFLSANDEGLNMVFTITGASTACVGGSVEQQPGTINCNYAGEVSIPERVRYKGVTYVVTAVGAGAFSPYYIERTKYVYRMSKVNIPATVQTIDGNAFLETLNLKAVAFADDSSLSSIGTSAFAYSGVESMVLPASLASLGARAFEGSGLSAIAFAGSGVTTFLPRTFAHTRLTSLDFVPASVSVFSDYAFAGSALRSAVVPATVRGLGQGVFMDCASLSLSSFAEGSPLTEIPTQTFSGCTALRAYEFQPFVVSVEASAFEGSGLRSATIPTTVTYLGEAAFKGCASLASVSFDAGHELMSISSELFSGCTALTGISLPASVRSLGSYAFSGCTALASFDVPACTTTLGDCAFEGCTALATLSFLGDATYLASSLSTFYHANSLASVVFYGKKATSLVFAHSLPSFYYTISYYANKADVGGVPLATYSVLANVTPQDATPDQVYAGSFSPAPEGGGSWVYETGFAPTAEMTESFHAYVRGSAGDLKVGDTFVDDTIEGVGVTYTVEALPEGTTPGRVRAGYEEGLVFRNAIDVATTGAVTLPELAIGSDGRSYVVDAIAPYAFSSCSRMITVSIPATVSSVGDRAFARCNALRNVYFQSDASSISDSAIFAGCGNIRRVVFGGKKANLSFGTSDPDVYYTVFYYETQHDLDIGNRQSTLVVHERALLDGLDASQVYSGFVPSLKVGFEWTYEEGFGGNVPLADSTSVFAAGIGFQASIAVRDGVVSTTSCWFKILEFDEDAKRGTVQVGLGKDGITAIHSSVAGTPVVPRQIADADGNVYDVVAVGDYAFGSDSPWVTCDYMTSISLPDSVRSIGRAAFENCLSLARIDVPASVASLGASVFEGCTGLARASLGSCAATSLPARAFYGCHGLSQVRLPAGLREIGEEAFAACYRYDEATRMSFGLRSLDIPAQVSVVGRRAFAGDALLGQAVLPAGLQELGAQAYEGCTGVASIRFNGNAEGVTFGAGAFGFGKRSSLRTLVFMDKKSTSVQGFITALDNKGERIAYQTYYNIELFASTASFEAGVPMGNLVIADDVAARWWQEPGNALEGSIPTLERGRAWRYEDGFGFDVRTSNSYYAIAGYDLSLAKVTFDVSDYLYSGEYLRPQPTVMWLDGSLLAQGRDYAIDVAQGRDGYANNRRGPTAILYLKGMGEYAGQLLGYFAIALQVDSSSSFSVAFPAVQKYTYDGTEKRPGVAVSATLMGDPYDAVEGEDYVVEYRDNVNAGTGYVVVRGQDVFGGTYEQEFVIAPQNIRTCSISGIADSYELAEDGIRPQITVVSKQGATLVEGTDFTVEYRNNKAVGNASVYIRGMGNYTGLVVKGFGISAGRDGNSGGGEGGGVGVDAGAGTTVGADGSTLLAAVSAASSDTAAVVAERGGGGNEGRLRIFEMTDGNIEVVQEKAGITLTVLVVFLVACGIVAYGNLRRRRLFARER